MTLPQIVTSSCILSNHSVKNYPVGRNESSYSFSLDNILAYMENTPNKMHKLINLNYI